MLTEGEQGGVKEIPAWIFRMTNYCEAVLKGCKPCAEFSLQDRHVEAAKKHIHEETLFVYTKFLCKGWTEVWIYKKKFMLEVIKNLPDKPKTVFDHWLLGKAFGYSDEAIEEFIEKQK